MKSLFKIAIALTAIVVAVKAKINNETAVTLSGKEWRAIKKLNHIDIGKVSESDAKLFNLGKYKLKS